MNSVLVLLIEVCVVAYPCDNADEMRNALFKAKNIEQIYQGFKKTKDFNGKCEI